MTSSLQVFSAATVSELQAEQQATQGQLNTVLLAELAVLWLQLDSNDKDGTFPDWSTTVAALIRQYAQAAATIGRAAYQSYRGLAVPSGSRFTPPVVPPPESEQITRNLGWATRAVGPEATPETMAAAQTQVNGSAQRLVTNTSRRALVDAVSTDDEARGWYRVPSSVHACAFCRLMTIRGAVYKSAATAGRAANSRFVGEGEFKFHDHCECTAAPLFKGQKPHVPDYVHTWDDVYTAATAGEGDKLNAFRRAVETS